MLRPGIFPMIDFHIFRQYEYDQCIKDIINLLSIGGTEGGVWPCRWSANTGWEFGEPLFNFYGQAPYWVGQIFHLLGFQIIDSVKLAFMFSLIASGFTMYLLAKYLWNDKSAALLSAIFYIYAPYRAVDVWVRGALPEAMAFVLFPLILFSLDKYIRVKKLKDLLYFTVLFALLIITHNLSVFMLSLILIPWTIIQLTRYRAWKTLPWLMSAGVGSGLLTAWYLLPVIFEQKYILLSRMISHYFHFDRHWVTLNQLLISRFWGYGGSVPGPDDGHSLSIGHLHWILPTLIFLYTIWMFASKRLRRNVLQGVSTDFLLWFFLGWFALFLTHAKSYFIWQIIPGIEFLQFPWRWLSLAVFAFSLASGAILAPEVSKVFHPQGVGKTPRYFLCGTLIFAVILLNIGFFKPDLWFNITDGEQFAGDRWTQQIARSAEDYWPIYGSDIPQAPAPSEPIFIEGKGEIINFSKQSHSAYAQIEVTTENALLEFPIAFFPGWKATSIVPPLTKGVRQLTERGVTPKNMNNEHNLEIITSKKYGQISLNLSQGQHQIKLNFINTPVRTIGNTLSLTALITWIGCYLLLCFRGNWGFYRTQEESNVFMFDKMSVRDFAIPSKAKDVVVILETPWAQYRTGHFTVQGWLFDNFHTQRYLSHFGRNVK